jgi:hypothetical protein
MPTIPAGVQPIDLTPRAYAVARLADRFLSTNLLGSRAFGPGVPLQPTVAPIDQAQPRQFQYPVSWNTQTIPRREYPDLTPFEQLRALAGAYDVATVCIRTIQDIVSGLELTIVAKDKKAQASEQAICDELMDFFRKPDRVTPFPMWMASLIHDMLVLDAMTIYPHMAQGGGLWGLEFVDGATIKPLLDARGQTAAYQQILYGMPWSDYERPRPDTDDDDFPMFSPKELFYLPRWTRSNTPYGFPPTESVIMRVNTALRKQTWDLSKFTDGNIPPGILSPPEGLMQPEQVAQFEEWWNAKLAGLDVARQRIIMLPWAGKFIDLHALSEGGQYESSLDEWMLKITCAAYAVPPQEIGFTADINRATGDIQQNALYRRCIIPTTVWLKRVVFDPVIQGVEFFNQNQLEAQWQYGETDDRKMLAETDNIYGQLGAVSASELRTMRYPDLDGPAPGVATPNGAGASPNVAIPAGTTRSDEGGQP